MVTVLSTLCWTGFALFWIGLIVGVAGDKMDGGDLVDALAMGWFFLGVVLIAIPGLMLIGIGMAGGA